MADGDAKKKYCLDTKAQIQSNFVDATKEHRKNQGGFHGFMFNLFPDFMLNLGTSIGSEIVSDEKYCDRPRKAVFATNVRANVLKQFFQL